MNSLHPWKFAILFLNTDLSLDSRFFFRLSFLPPSKKLWIPIDLSEIAKPCLWSAQRLVFGVSINFKLFKVNHIRNFLNPDNQKKSTKLLQISVIISASFWYESFRLLGSRVLNDLAFLYWLMKLINQLPSKVIIRAILTEMKYFGLGSGWFDPSTPSYLILLS